jgi:hypothetical protein
MTGRTEEERCNCGGVIVFDDENGVAHCYRCGSHESYTTPALRERLRLTVARYRRALEIIAGGDGDPQIIAQQEIERD